MTEREQRVVNAFLETVWKRNETKEYIILMMEDDERFGWMSETAKRYFYDHVDNPPKDPVEEDE